MDTNLLRRLNVGKGIVASFVLIVLLVGFSSCQSGDEPDGPDEFVVWDLTPVTVDVRFVDNTGANLLDEETEGNWIGQPFTLTCNDETFELKWSGWRSNLEDPYVPQSRAYMPRFYGFAAREYRVWNGNKWIHPKGQYYLSFGEFDAGDNYDFSVQLNVPGVDDVYMIDVKHTIVWTKEGPAVFNEFLLNGEPVKELPIKIVLPRLSKQ